jgi:hypothetical protein
MSNTGRLRDEEGELGEAFRSADRDGPSKGASAALIASLSLGAASGTLLAMAAGSAPGSVGLVKPAAASMALWKLVVLSAVAFAGLGAVIRLVVPAVGHAVAPVTPAMRLASLRPSFHRLAAGSRRTPHLHTTSAEERVALEVAPSAPTSPSPSVGDIPSSAPARQPPTPRMARAQGLSGAATEVMGSVSAPSITPTTVSAELSVLKHAKSLLDAGHYSETLDVIASYQRTFAHPALADEAMTMRIEALALDGRRAEASSLGRSDLQRSPEGPLAARVRRALASDR